MQFPTIVFTLFFLSVLVVWWGVLKPNALSARQRFMIAASLVFYAFSGWQWTGILLSVSLVAWLGMKWIESSPTKWRGWTVVGALVVHLAAWKYTAWAVFSHNTWAEQWGWALWAMPEWAYPVGLSFFTFHALSMVIDVWQQKLKPYSFEQTLAQVSFFPALLAGPVLRNPSIADRLQKEFVFDNVKWLKAVGLVALGMTFKWVLSTQAAVVSDPVFQGLAGSTLEVWWGVHAYGAQIFFDFAGYSLMAIGLALMLGFELPDNFRQPYLATSAKEFWSSWHRSLSFFFRDYVYIGLMGGNSKGKMWAMIAAATTMLISGVWHGASVTFVIWGAWHAAWLMSERLIPYRDSWPKWLGWIVSMEIAMWGWVWFRANDIDSAQSIFAQGWSAVLPLVGVPSMSVLVWTLIGLMVVLVERFVLRGLDHAQMRLDQPNGSMVAQGSCLVMLGAWAWMLMMFGPVGVPPFIYNGF